MAASKTTIRKKETEAFEEKVRFSNVSSLMESMSGDDSDFIEEFEDRVRSREVTKALQFMRISAGLAQSDIADELECSQGRVSKLENGFDDDLKLGDIEGYAKVLGKGVHIQFLPRNETSFERIKRLSFAISAELKKMVELANKDDAIAKGVAGTFAEILLNQICLLKKAAEELPFNPTTEEPFIQVELTSDREAQSRTMSKRAEANEDTSELCPA